MVKDNNQMLQDFLIQIKLQQQQLFLMQQKAEHKQKTNAYHSTKDYQSYKESTHKITTKPSHQKSYQTQKLTKGNPHSSSKSKISNKHVKNNQNFNSINHPQSNPKNKSTNEPQNLKKLARNSSQKLIKSKSTLKLAPKTERNRQSQSPIMFKEQPKYEQKSKISKTGMSKVDKDKKAETKNKEEKHSLKRSTSMAVYQTKKQNTERSHVNRISIKTEGSSKMNSVIKEDQRHKKSKKSAKTSIMKKQGQQKMKEKNLGAKKIQKTKLQNKIKKSILYSQVSFQQFCHQNPCESALVPISRAYQHEDYIKVKTEGCQINCQVDRFSQRRMIQLHDIAATKIQKVFRGYITRKYIEQAKIIITKVRIIQKWWRKIIKRRKQKTNKPSVQNSLITIKDFNETIKSQRQKLFSQSKQNTLSNRKLNIKEIIKNILEENENQSEKSVIMEDKKLRVQCLSPEDKMINKQVYIESKIKAQIYSQKVFNSPKLMTSPRSIQTPTSIVSIKDFFNNSSQRLKVKQMLQSPKMKSPQPQPPKSTPKSNKAEQQHKFQIYKQPSTQIQPFQTNFQAVQQISLILVDFFRDRPFEMTNFLNRIKQLKYFRTEIILKNWKQFKFLSDSYYEQMQDSILPADYQYLELFSKPRIFPLELRQQIIKFPSFEIDLNAKNYHLEDQTNKPIHLCYLHFIFDVLEEAFYQSYRQCVLEWPLALNSRLQCNQKMLFELAFSDSLGYLCKWAEIMCGFFVSQPQDYSQQREQRMKLFERQIQPWDLGRGNKLGLKIQIADKIEQELCQQILSWLIQKQM